MRSPAFIPASHTLGQSHPSVRFDSVSGEGITNVYDGFGRLASTSTNMGGTTRTLAYLHDANSNRIQITHPDGNRFETDYDGLNRPILIWQNEYTAMSGMSYYNHGGVSGLSRANGTANGFGYDAVQRLSGMVQYLAGTVHDATWGYGRNPAGGIASVARDNDAYAWTGHYATTRAYITNGLNQYSQAGGTSLTYDANGNLTVSGSSTYLYDIENRMVGAPNNIALTYDPLGRLFQVSNTITGGATRFLYDGDALVAEYNAAGTMTRRYVHNVGAYVPLLSYADSNLSAPSYLHADERGSIAAISDASGNGAVNTYDEYGIPGATNVGRFQYTGQIWLPELGMYYYKARIYSPYLGRFMQTDPIGYDDQFNLYAYVGNDPINATDPSGTHKCQGNDADCGKIAGYANQVRSAARSASQSTGTRIPSSYARALNGVANFLGDRDTDNGVTIVSADLPDRVLGNHGPGPNGSTVIELDLPNIERDRSSTGAGVLAHEAMHGIQERVAGQPRNLQEIYNREFGANVMESLTNQFLGQETSVWSPTMSPQERVSRIRRGAFLSCDFVRQQYPSRFRGQSCPR